MFTLPNTPPCIRYDADEYDDRLIKVWIYVGGLVGGGENYDELCRSVACLYDLKGDFSVIVRKPLPPHVQRYFAQAWRLIGREREECGFVDVKSERWKDKWKMRRFENDWGL